MGIERNQDLSVLRERLEQLQLPQIAYRRRAIIIFEGLEGSGKKRALKQLAAAFDPCHYSVYSIEHDRREAADGHWLARFWRALPAAGHSSIFYRSWYRRVLDERVRGRVDPASAARAFDEINEFEAQQRDYGTLLVKLFFNVTPGIQQQRLREQSANPWAGLIASGGDAVRADDPAYAAALADLKRHTDTRWSPWRMIDGDDEDAVARSALAAIADAWAEAMPANAIENVA
jgi:polyphosphate kinase 2 (PPK2 family)